MPPTGCFAVRPFRGKIANLIQIEADKIRNCVTPLKSIASKQPVGDIILKVFELILIFNLR